MGSDCAPNPSLIRTKYKSSRLNVCGWISTGTNIDLIENLQIVHKLIIQSYVIVVNTRNDLLYLAKYESSLNECAQLMVNFIWLQNVEKLQMLQKISQRCGSQFYNKYEK